jgi:hypothetical protein
MSRGFRGTKGSSALPQLEGSRLPDHGPELVRLSQTLQPLPGSEAEAEQDETTVVSVRVGFLVRRPPGRASLTFHCRFQSNPTSFCGRPRVAVGSSSIESPNS